MQYAKDRYHAGRRLFFFCTKVQQVKSVLLSHYLYIRHKHEQDADDDDDTDVRYCYDPFRDVTENGQRARSQWIWLKRLEFWAVRKR